MPEFLCFELKLVYKMGMKKVENRAVLGLFGPSEFGTLKISFHRAAQLNWGFIEVKTSKSHKSPNLYENEGKLDQK
jgi:hypothetical protein